MTIHSNLTPEVEIAGEVTCSQCGSICCAGHAETGEQKRIEIEDDLRCRDCGSTEAGNCFSCKMD